MYIYGNVNYILRLLIQRKNDGKLLKKEIKRVNCKVNKTKQNEKKKLKIKFYVKKNY